MMEGGGLPPGWVSCELGDIIELEYGKALPAKARNSNGKIGVYGSNGCVGRHTKALVEGPCIVVGRKGTAGAVEYSKDDCWPIDTTYFVRSSEHQETRFLFFLLKYLRLGDLDRSTAIPGLNRDDAYALRIQVPPFNEQRRIVEKIETLFARLDKGEEALRAVRTLLARYRQSVLKAAVTGQLTADWRAENAHRLEHGRDLLARILQTRRETWEGRGKYKEPMAPDTSGLPELPEGWVWTTLEHLGFVKSGQTPKGVDTLVDPAGTIPWFKVSSMNEPGNEVELRTSQWIFTEDGAKTVGLNLLPTGTIAFPKRGGAILTNKKRRLGCRAALDLNTMGFIPVALEDYVWAFFQRLDLRTIYDGSNVPQINYHDIADVPIALPPSIEEAGVIADLVGESIEQTARLEGWCETELARSGALRQSILKEAFAGRLVAQDPTDEPASDLLAHIKETRAPAPKKTRRKVPA